VRLAIQAQRAAQGQEEKRTVVLTLLCRLNVKLKMIGMVLGLGTSVHPFYIATLFLFFDF
jgi:hypothetical protein